MLWSAMAHTAASIRTGVPQAKHDFAAMGEEELLAFLRSLDPGLRRMGRDLAGRVDFAGCRAVADVGGGSGGLALALTEAYPYLHATVIELPRVAPVARRLLAEVGACERVEVVAADVVAGPPPGAYDAAMLVRFTQVLSAEENRRALRHVAETLAPGGAIYILAVVVDDTRTAPEAAVRADLLLLNLYDHGRAYTEGEYRAWLAEAGFAGIERTIVGADSSLLGARKEG